MPLRFLPALLLLATAGASAQTYEGQLRPGDDTLTSGEFVDEYAVEAARGDTVRAVVTSDEFDTYVIVKSETGEQAEDDDCTEGETTRSCALFVADADGPVRVLVTSFQPGETGLYRVDITVARSAEAARGDGAGR
jgi:hypothetical protein